MRNGKKSLTKALCIVLMYFIQNTYADASLSPYQASERPFGLDIVGEVYIAASDEASVDFQNNYLPEINQIVQNNLGERMSLNNETLDSIALDPNKLNLSYDADLRVYFVGEGAGYHNTLGFNTEAGGIQTGNPQLIFPDASVSSDYLNPDNPVNRNNNTPLAQGDFVELGTFSEGTELDFFLIANGANGGSYVYSTDESVNPDGIQHVVSFAIENSSYLFLGFEDLYNGGDRDYNDLLFAVDIGTMNVNQLIETSALVPEPEEVLLTIIFALCLLKYLKGSQHINNNKLLNIE
ncbi:DUF4114 domain-containing protein [Lentisphaera marina]|uniref:DUF4114 domain-containing protein n=1 Tax=Lentisphaera marina TaxID=1111041 RepID=UPI002366180D|nr:DUF4114 domain-containing protein [Lentisphaera marina]MDD7986130.1 DUF4114 domain-containing protein [Lentisphaera marina]